MELSPAFLMLVWIPISGLVVHPHQRIKAMAFCVLATLTLILQVELLNAFHLDRGITGWMSMAADLRALIGWSVCILIYLGLSMISPASRGILYFAASLSIYLIACVLTFVIMIL